jgi:membrane fusion protein, multidrug efflux system
MKQTTNTNTIRALMGIWALTFIACSNGYKTEVGQPETDSTVMVQTHAVAVTERESPVTLSGTVEAATAVKLGFMVPGKVSRISRQVGQPVVKGQVLASLEQTSYAINEQLARVQLSEADDEHARLKLLHERGSVSESEFVKSALALQKATLQQKLEVKNLDDTKLVSPISGILLDKQVEAGEIVSAGTPLLTVANISKVKISAFVPETELSGLHIGQRAQVEISALNKSFTGKIIEIGTVAEAASRAFTIKIGLDNPALQIRPGMIAEAKVTCKGKRPIIELPLECVLHEAGNESYVFVAGNSGRTAFKRKVSLGAIEANKIQVLSGLSVGDLVVTSGQTKLSDGSLITIEKQSSR